MAEFRVQSPESRAESQKERQATGPIVWLSSLDSPLSTLLRVNRRQRFQRDRDISLVIVAADFDRYLVADFVRLER